MIRLMPINSRRCTLCFVAEPLKIVLDKRMAFRHTSIMKRTTVWLTDPQVTALEKLAKKTGLKQAELIRRFIDAGLEKGKP